MYRKRLAICFLCVFILEIYCKSSSFSKNLEQKSLKDTGWLGKLNEFLDGYLVRLWKGNLKLPDKQNMRRFLLRRNEPPVSFEQFERAFLTQEAMKYLDEFIGYAERVHNDTDTRTHLEEARRREQQRLKLMPLSQIKEYITTVKQALQHKTNNRHEITISGHTYSLDHVSDWCCSLGG